MACSCRELWSCFRSTYDFITKLSYFIRPYNNLVLLTQQCENWVSNQLCSEFFPELNSLQQIPAAIPCVSFEIRVSRFLARSFVNLAILLLLLLLLLLLCVSCYLFLCPCFNFLARGSEFGFLCARFVNLLEANIPLRNDRVVCAATARWQHFHHAISGSLRSAILIQISACSRWKFNSIWLRSPYPPYRSDLNSSFLRDVQSLHSEM